jgi:hypothetical protein
MAKITLANGTIIEGTIEEIKRMGVKFPVMDEPLKVGDYAKVIFDGNGCSDINDIVLITEVEDSEIPYNTQHINGAYAGWHYIDSLVRATDEEIAKETERKEIETKWAKIGRKPGEVKVGDIVRRAPGYYDIVANIYGGNKLAVGEELVAPVEARFDR